MMNIPNLASFYNAPFPIVRASAYAWLFFRPKPPRQAEISTSTAIHLASLSLYMKVFPSTSTVVGNKAKKHKDTKDK